MIFINLLPEIKIEFIKAQRIRRTLVSVTFIVSLCCIAICSYFYYEVKIANPNKWETLKASNDALVQSVAQHIKLDQTDEDGILSEIPQNLEDILNIQRRLQYLSLLHANKTEPQRLFSFHDLSYLDKLMYGGSVYNSINFDFKENTFSIEGQAQNASLANDLEASLIYIGFEDCTEDNKDSRIYPFSNIVFSKTSDPTRANSVASYTVSGNFDPDLFISKDQYRINQGWDRDSKLYLNDDPNQRLQLVVPRGVYSSNVYGRGTLCKQLDQLQPSVE